VPEGREHVLGELVSQTGNYEQLNVFGTPTGKTIHVQRGEHLPAAPHGFTWRRTAQQLRERAAAYRGMAATAATAQIGDEFIHLAERLERLAAQRDDAMGVSDRGIGLAVTTHSLKAGMMSHG
jgi:hypothetical protein